jgi:hypothetical protein
MTLIAIFSNPVSDFFSTHGRQSRPQLIHLADGISPTPPRNPSTQRFINRPAPIAGRHSAQETPGVVFDYDVDASAHNSVRAASVYSITH